MERGVNYIFIGACFILSLIAFVVFIFWFSDSGFFKDDMKSYKSYTKRPLNIKVDSIIKYKGINVGRVSDIRFKNSDFEEIEISLEIRKDLPIKADSILRVEQSGILGANFLSLMQNEKSKDFIDEGAVIMIGGDSMSQIMEAIPNIAGKVDYLLENASGVVSEENAKNLTAILLSLNEVVKNINILAKSLSKNTSDIEKIIANISQITNILNTKIANGEYDLKSTITPMLLSVEKAMGELEQFGKNGNKFIQNLEDNPYNTIFGYREEK